MSTCNYVFQCNMKDLHKHKNIFVDKKETYHCVYKGLVQHLKFCKYLGLINKTKLLNHSENLTTIYDVVNKTIILLLFYTICINMLDKIILFVVWYQYSVYYVMCGAHILLYHLYQPKTFCIQKY